MISKNQIKFLQSLKQLKFRKEHGLFIAEGKKIVEELIPSGIRVREVYALQEWIDEKRILCDKYGTKAIPVSGKELDRISNLSTPNMALALCQIPVNEVVQAKEGILIGLDGIRDPGNLGTIIRTADWFGLDMLICSRDCVDVYNPKVVQSSMGSIARVKVVYTDLEEYLSEASLPVYATVLEGKNIWKEKPGDGIYLIGNESRGIGKNILRFATHRIAIPSLGKAESLNASVATGIVLAEVMKAREGNNL